MTNLSALTSGKTTQKFSIVGARLFTDLVLFLNLKAMNGK